MANLTVWLLALVGPMAKKLLVMLGFGVVTYAAVNELVQQVISMAQSNYGQIGGAAGQLLAMAGIPDVLGIIAGALLARASFVALGKIGKVTT